MLQHDEAVRLMTFCEERNIFIMRETSMTSTRTVSDDAKIHSPVKEIKRQKKEIISQSHNLGPYKNIQMRILFEIWCCYRWICYHLLSFLNDKLQPRKTFSNLTLADDDE